MREGVSEASNAPAAADASESESEGNSHKLGLYFGRRHGLKALQNAVASPFKKPESSSTKVHYSVLRSAAN